MNAFKCDRCGGYYDKKEEDIGKVPFTVNRYDTNKGYYVLIDLCAPCYNELNKFMREESEK